MIQKTLQTAYHISDPFQAKTPWLMTVVSVAKTFESILAADYRGTHSVVLLTSTLNAGVPVGQWLRYDSDRFLAISYTDKKQILQIVRESLDRGWPTTFETIDHVMTAIGYKTIGDSYVYAISDSSGAYAPRQGISWVSESEALNYFTDATVYYDAVSDLLPKPLLTESLLPSVKIPRKGRRASF